mgnify:FL=1
MIALIINLTDPGIIAHLRELYFADHGIFKSWRLIAAAGIDFLDAVMNDGCQHLGENRFLVLVKMIDAARENTRMLNDIPDGRLLVPLCDEQVLRGRQYLLADLFAVFSHEYPPLSDSNSPSIY